MSRFPLRQARVSRLKRIYDSLPSIECKRLCQAACGVVPMTVMEYQRVRAVAGRDPQAGGFGSVCPVLGAGGSCSAYAVRPLVCRLWGLVDHPYMRCPHGCVPERWVTDDEAEDLIRRVEAIGGRTLFARGESGPEGGE